LQKNDPKNGLFLIRAQAGTLTVRGRRRLFFLKGCAGMCTGLIAETCEKL
jgi:hypothetical protein